MAAALAWIRAELAKLRGDIAQLGVLHGEIRQQLEAAPPAATASAAGAPAAQYRSWRFGESPAQAFARAATAPAPPATTSPAFKAGTEWKYSARLQTKEEFERIAVPLEEAPTRLRSVLDEFGFAVVTGVISSEEELHEFEEDFKQDLTDLVDVDALQDAAPGVRQAYQRFLSEGPLKFPLATVTGYLTQAAGFVLERCLGHGRFAWRARRHPRVHAAFQPLFPGEGDKLVTSLDVTFFTPGGQPATESNGMSAHVDQNKHDVRPGLAERNTYQGVLYVWPAGPDGMSSTTVVWPGSHREIWPELMEDPMLRNYGEMGLHYSEISSMANQSESRRLAAAWAEHARRVVVPPGGLLLWNSRTVHTGWRGGPRLAQTVCLEPVSRRPAAERASKLRLAALGLPACHWASAGMQHDMSLGAPGCFAGEGVNCRDASNGKNPDAVVLPLRSALKPAAQADGADLDRLEDLVNVEYRHCGMWVCPEEDEDLLEASVKEEFKEYL